MIAWEKTSLNVDVGAGAVASGHQEDRSHCMSKTTFVAIRELLPPKGSLYVRGGR